MEVVLLLVAIVGIALLVVPAPAAPQAGGRASAASSRA